jgi:hypothetical protein
LRAAVGLLATTGRAKFMKPRKAVLVLAGHLSRCNTVIVKTLVMALQPTPTVLVAGTDHYPCKATAAMAQKKISMRSKIKCFVKKSKKQLIHLIQHEQLSKQLR